MPAYEVPVQQGGRLDNEPCHVLPDRSTVADYLHAFNVPDWEAKATSVDPPLSITKVGAQVWARA